jgi:hypothetical protein
MAEIAVDWPQVDSPQAEIAVDWPQVVSPQAEIAVDWPQVVSPQAKIAVDWPHVVSPQPKGRERLSMSSRYSEFICSVSFLCRVCRGLMGTNRQPASQAL